MSAWPFGLRTPPPITYRPAPPIPPWHMTGDPSCQRCGGEGWVCENHEDHAWGYGEGCCGGAGMPCVCLGSLATGPESS